MLHWHILRLDAPHQALSGASKAHQIAEANGDPGGWLLTRSMVASQFNADALADALKLENIGYFPLPALGGLRHPRKNSPNTGWRNTSFRGYADYMQSSALRGGAYNAHSNQRAGTYRHDVRRSGAVALPPRLSLRLIHSLLARSAGPPVL
jgi:hypothetical protein